MQLPFDFQPGLAAQFPFLEDVLAAAVYSSRKGLNGVAADLDTSPSELCRRLNRNGDDIRPLRVQDAVAIIKSTGDLRPVYWLIDTFMGDPAAKRDQAMTQLAAMVPVFRALAEQAGIDVGSAKKKGRA